MKILSKIHEDVDGNKSSKRVYGGGLIVNGMFILNVVAAAGLFHREFPNIGHTIEVGTTMIGLGAALLGIGVVEHLGKALSKRKIKADE